MSHRRASAALVLSLVVLAACRDTSGPDGHIPIVLLVQHADTLAEGDTLVLGVWAQKTPGYVPPLTWSSSDTRVATVDAATASAATAVVRAHSPGRAVVTVQGAGKRDSAVITVDTLLSGVSGFVVARAGALPAVNARVTARTWSGRHCTGTVAATRSASVDATGAYALTIPQAPLDSPGWGCVTVAVEPAVGSGLAPDSAVLTWGGDVIPAVLNWPVSFGLQPAAPADPAPGTRSFSQVSASYHHTCALTTTGEALCWGLDVWGELGSPSSGACANLGAPGGPAPIACGVTPLPVPSVPPLTQIDAQSGLSCGLAAQRLYCWGESEATPAVATPPALVATAPAGITAADGLCVLDATGLPHCWSWPNLFTRAPTAVGDSVHFTRLAAGYSAFCGITAANAAWCWGTNYFAQLGNGTTSGSSAVPVPVTGGHAFREISVGAHATCGLDTDGRAWCWGLDDRGQLGIGAARPGTCVLGINYEPACSGTPLAVAGGLAFTSVVTGGYHACGLTADGAAWCWGDNSAGQLGLGRRDTVQHRTPEPLPGALRFRLLSAGEYHTCGISLSGGVYCWGRNDYGQLGEGSLADRWQPTRVAGSGT